VVCRRPARRDGPGRTCELDHPSGRADPDRGGVTPDPGEALGGDTGAGVPPPFPGSAPPPPAAPPAFPSQAPVGYPTTGWPGTSEGVPYASWGIRVGGYLIDAVIFLVVLGVFAILFRHTHALDVHFMARRGTRRRNFSSLPFLFTGLCYIAYGTLLCGSARGQTLGMMAVGVRAVRDETLGVLGYGRALGRAVFEGVLRLINLLFFLLGLVWILDMLFPLWDKKRQTLHDKVAGSVVLRVRPAG
jgi:uncharacterized RDD family membrane protein YckC